MSLAAFVLLSASLGAGTDDVPAVVGTVVDAQNRPIAGADVYLFDGPPLGRAALFGLGGKTRQPPFLFAHVETTDTGEFAVALPVDAPPPHGRAPTWLALAIHKRGLAVKTRLIEREWPACAAPIRLVLATVHDNRVRVRSPADNPVPEALLRVDQIDGIPLPDELSARLAAESDTSGEAELPDVAGEDLRTIYIEAKQFGAQWAAMGRPSAGGVNTVILSPVGAINGQLIDDEGAALPLKRVRLATWVEPRDELAGGGVTDVITDTEGRFNVPVIAAGVLQLAAELPQDSPLLSTYQGTQQIEAGISNGVNIRFKRGVHIHGTVIDQSDRRPIAGAIVSLGLTPDAPRLECNEAGEYSGYVLPGLTYLTFARLPPSYYLPNARVPLETVRDDAKEMTFKPLVAAAGATLIGRVVDAAGQPVPDAELIGACHWSDFDSDRSVYARSDRDGNFMLPNVTTDTNIRIMAYSAAGVSTKPVIGNARDPDPITITVVPEAAISLSGRVTDVGGRPIANAAVRVLPVRVDQNRRAIEETFVAFNGAERLYTDAEGRFATPKQLRPDRGYRIEVDARGMSPVRTEPIEPAIWQVTGFGEIMVAPTPRLRAVAGLVVDESGRPVAGALVRQSGDGPRRTRATCDTDGRFSIDGIYEGPAWLLVGHDGIPLQAERIDGEAHDVRLVLRNRAVSSRHGTTTAPSIDAAEDDVRRSLFAEIRERLLRGSSSDRQWVAITEFLLDGKLPDDHPREVQMRVGFALGRSGVTCEQAIELAQSTEDMSERCSLYLAAFGAIGSAPDQQRDALAEALLAARAINDPPLRIPLLGEIGERFFDHGNREVGTAVVREARDQLLAAGEAGVPNLELWQGKFAAALAYLDVPAAYALAEKTRKPQRDWFLADMARSLAGENPAEAERALDRMEMANLRYAYGAGTVHRMAAVDSERAARIARRFEMPSSRAYGLGLVAEAQATIHRQFAENLVEEAYGILEQSLADGTADTRQSTCGTAAALLVIVNRVIPVMFDHYLARALAMRPPRPARGDPGAWYEAEIAQMALAIAPFDRQTARALLEPLAPRIRTLSAVGEQYASPGQIWAAFALTDPRWAQELINLIPDAPPEVVISPRATAARHVVRALIDRGARRWPTVYRQYLHARHPDTPVRER
ncbi:MAG TPA: carboxypeptidase-like regulatory domain-containing protein [Pirellulales bacterium]